MKSKTLPFLYFILFSLILIFFVFTRLYSFNDLKNELKEKIKESNNHTRKHHEPTTYKILLRDKSLFASCFSVNSCNIWKQHN